MKELEGKIRTYTCACVSRNDDTTELLQKQHDGTLTGHSHVGSPVVLICRTDIQVGVPKDLVILCDACLMTKHRASW